MAQETENRNQTSFRSFTRFQWTVLLVFGCVNIFSAVTYSIQAPFYPAEAERKNATAFEYGLVFGCYELTAFIMCPLLGSYMYLIGPKKGFNAGVIIAGISMILFGFLDRIDELSYFITFSLFLRIMQGIGTSSLFVSIYSFVTLEFPNSVATVFAIMETAYGFGSVTGPVLGELLFQLGGFKLPFLIFGGLLVCSPIVAHFVLIKPRDPANPERQDVLNNNDSRVGGILHLITIPSIILTIFGTFIGGFSLGFVAASLEPHLRQFDLSPGVTGLVFLSYPLMYAFTGPIIGCICDRISQPEYVTITGASLIFVGFLGIGPAPFIPIKPIIWSTLAGLIGFGLGLAALYVSTFILTLKITKQNNYPDSVATYGLVSGLWMSSLSFGSFLGPLAAGFFTDRYGFRSATYIILALTSTLILLLVVSQLKRRICWTEQNPDENSDGRSLLNSPGLIWDAENVETAQ